MTNANKVIHEAMGLCWHKFDTPTYVTYQPQEQEMCSKCGCPETIYLEWPDYTSPVHYCALMEWLRKDINRSYEFYRWCKSKHDMLTMYHWFQLTKQHHVNLIAEAIEAGVLK